MPAGRKAVVCVPRIAGNGGTTGSDSSLALNPTGFVALGPMPEHMTGCSGCYDYGTHRGTRQRHRDRSDHDHEWQYRRLCWAASAAASGRQPTAAPANTTWSVTTDSPLLSTTSIDTLALDPNNHNTIYAGTGDLNYGSFSMGSQGILKSTDGGNTWTVLGADVFGPEYIEPAANYPQYDSVGKVRVDPNNSNNIVAGTKKGLWFSYDQGVTWS